MKRSISISRMLVLFLLAGCLVASAQVSVTPNIVAISAQVNGAATTQTLSLTSATAGQGFLTFISYTTSAAQAWLTVSSSGSTTPATLNLTASPTGLTAGTYTASLQIAVSNNQPTTVPITFTVSNLGLTPSSVTFAYTLGGSIPATQSITVSSVTSTGFSAAATTASGGNWLQVAPTQSSTTPAAITVQLNSAVVTSLAAGTYTGSITITPTNTAVGGTATIPVTLTVSAPVTVTVGPPSMNFGVQVGGSNNLTQQTLQIATNSPQAIGYFITSRVDPNTSGLNWLLVNPVSGTIPANGTVPVTISIVTTSLATGTYNGTLTVNVFGATPASQDVPVRLTIANTPLLNVTSTPLTFTYQIGTATPAAQTVAVTSTGAALTYSVSAATTSGGQWLSVGTALQTTPNGFTVSVNPQGLPVGTYNGTITVTGSNTLTAPQSIPVVLKVGNDPAVTATPGSLTLLYQKGQSSPAIQTVKISSTTGLPLTYTTSADKSWISLGGTTSGTTDGLISVTGVITAADPGTYDGTITVTATNPATGTAAVNSPLAIPVRAYVSTTPLLVTSANALQFTAQVGGTPPAQQITLNSTSGASTDQIQYTVQALTDTAGTWLFAGPTVATTPNQLTVTVVPSLLSAGTYTGSVKITATGPGGAVVANSPITIPVTLTLTSGALTVTPNTTLTFSGVAGGAITAAQTLQIATSGSSSPYTATAQQGSAAVTWLTVSPAAGTTPGTVSVTADPSRLTPGTWPGSVTITVAGAAGSPVIIPVTFTVGGGQVTISASSLAFSVTAGGAQAQPQTLTVTGSGYSFTATASVTSGASGWLSVSPSSGTLPSTVTVTTNANTLGVGNYSGTVMITVPGAPGSPFTIPATLTVNPGQSLTATPVNLQFTYTIGQSVPAAQTVQVSSSGGAASFSATAATVSGGNWLTVSPTSGSTPGSLSVSIAPQNLAAGNYSGTITITSPSASSQTVAVTLAVVALPPPAATTIVNAASFAPGAVAPGELITIGGTGVGPAGDVQVAGPTGGFYPTTFSDTQVTFDGIPAPIYYVSARQSSVFVPYGIAGRVTTRLVVSYKGVSSPPIDLRVVDSAPAIFTVNQSGSGPGVIQNQDYSLNTSSKPAAKGSVVIIYATGEGQTSPTGVDGQVIPADITRVKRPLLPVTATIGGRPATVQYAGSVGGLVSGVLQVNVLVPNDAPSGSNVPITVLVGSVATQAGVTLAVQ